MHAVIVSPRDTNIGERVRAAGYLGADGWATVEAKDNAARAITVRFSDGDRAVWSWGPRGGGGRVVIAR